jgi:hypothetical protein
MMDIFALEMPALLFLVGTADLLGLWLHPARRSCAPSLDFIRPGDDRPNRRL